MKKLIFCSIVIIAFISIIILEALSISSSKKYNLTSQIQYNYFLLKNDNYIAELSCGLREDNFDYDGISNNKLEYGILKVEIYGFTGYASNIDVVLNISDKNYPYILEKNPFDNSYMCDLEFIIQNNNKIKLKINAIDNNFNEFECVSNLWKMNYKSAQQKGYDVYNSFIKENNKNNKSCECYLTVIYNGYQNTNYYWVFKVQTTDLKSKMIVIDTNTCEIVLKS